MAKEQRYFPVSSKYSAPILVFFQNEEIFVVLDELDELDKIKHAWIAFTASHKHRIYSSVMVKVVDS